MRVFGPTADDKVAVFGVIAVLWAGPVVHYEERNR